MITYFSDSFYFYITEEYSHEHNFMSAIRKRYYGIYVRRILLYQCIIRVYKNISYL